MRISTRGRYAVRIMLDIALHQGDSGAVCMKDIARRQQISKKYGDQIAMTLSQTGFLNAVRGRQGGYRLSRDPKDVTLLQLLRAVEGSLCPVECLECPDVCHRDGFCMTRPVWAGLDRLISDYLQGLTLQSLIDGAKPQPELDECPVPE